MFNYNQYGDDCFFGQSGDDFANEYACLLETATQQDKCLREEITRKTMEITEEYRDFKAAGTDGITNCKIRCSLLEKVNIVCYTSVVLYLKYEENYVHVFR